MTMSLNMISKFYREWMFYQNQILYCVHLLCLKRRNLQSGNKYSFGKPYEDYKRALLGYGLSMEMPNCICRLEKQGEIKMNKTAKIINISNVSGGVGKSTTAMNWQPILVCRAKKY